jgi:uncharacterized membrane protein YraQ (UPF0718 family)
MERLQDTLTIFLAIMVEATPFVVLGVLVSAVLSAFVRDEWLLRLRTNNRFASHMISACLGFLFPVCECGNVPVMRSLLAKGFSVSQAISFYLGAPILNIVVIATTVAAFEASPVVILGRVIGGFVVASTVGIILSYHRNSNSLLTPATIVMCEADHGQEKGLKYLTSQAFVRRFLKEFFSMMNLLIIGAAIASITQLWIPRDFVFSLASVPILAILSMMVLTVILSVCSTVDAFIALAYSSQFTPGALVAFLVYGPMIDVKAISMLLTTFKPRAVAYIVFLVTMLTILISLIVTMLGY